jgi:lysophospholipase L1-like esterase
MGSPAVRTRLLIALPLLLSFLAALVLAAPSQAADRLTKPVRILPLGDSITFGLSTGMPGDRSPGGYRSTLDGLLSNARIPHTFLGTMTANSSPTLMLRGEDRHEGHSGYRVDQVTTDLNGIAGGNTDNGGCWLTGTSEHAPMYPEVVIIHLGTNDITHWYDPGVQYPDGIVDYSDPKQRARFASDLANRLKALVDKIYSLRPSTHIVLSNIVPIEANSFEPVSREYSYFVARVVDQERGLGRPIVFADVFHKFAHVSDDQTILYPGMMSDGGIHPSTLGYNVMANVYANAVQAVLKLG